jgi:hypothetical protein
MPKKKPEAETGDKQTPSERQPLIIPILPNDEADPLPPEPIEAPPDSEQQPPTPIDENPKEPKVYV